MKYKPGDVVELNSGSPPLTVTGMAFYADGPKLKVCWVVEGQAHTEAFPEECLKPYKEKKESP